MIFLAQVELNSRTGEITFRPPIYELAEWSEPKGKYEQIKHTPSGKTVTISEDVCVTKKATWFISDKWSWQAAALRGTRQNDNIFDMFEEQGEHAAIDYDTNTFLDEAMGKALKEDPSMEKAFEVMFPTSAPTGPACTPPAKGAAALSPAQGASPPGGPGGPQTPF